MTKYKVKLFSETRTVDADYYVINRGGTLSFSLDGNYSVSFNPRVWNEVEEVQDEV